MCSGRRASPRDNLATAEPSIAAEWGTQNAQKPEAYRPGSAEVVWWTCGRGHSWQASINNRTNPHHRSGCPTCAGQRATPEYNLAEALPELLQEWAPSNQQDPHDLLPKSNVIAEWVCRQNPAHRWSAAICDRADGHGCPRCHHLVSGPEIELATFLQGLGLEIRTSVRDVLPNRQELDILIPSRQLAIEYCGLYFHRDDVRGRPYHLDKLEACARLGIRLITIFESEWISRRPIVYAFLASILGQKQTRIGARTLTLCEAPPWREVEEFLDKHHLQGASAPGTYTAVLRQNDRVIAALVCRRGIGRHAAPGWELSRYCVASGVCATGAFARLWAAFRRSCDPDLVVTFADRRWSGGDLYLRHGFRFDRNLPPAYWYFKRGKTELLHRRAFQKHKLGVLPGETEWEAMTRLGHFRIWDCGLSRFSWQKVR